MEDNRSIFAVSQLDRLRLACCPGYPQSSNWFPDPDTGPYSAVNIPRTKTVTLVAFVVVHGLLLGHFIFITRRPSPS